MGEAAARGTPQPSYCALCEEAIESHERKAKGSPRLQELRRLLDPSVSFERAYHELNDPRRRPTPATTVEAIMVTVRERGVAALKNSANIDRLRGCDAAAKSQINQRISELKRLGRIR